MCNDKNCKDGISIKQLHTHTSNQKPLKIINVYSDYVLGVDIVHICLHLNFGTLV